MTEFSVAMHNYSGVNHVARFHGCLNLKCPGDIISPQVIEYLCMSRAIVDCTDSELDHLENYVRYGQAPFALHWTPLV